MEDKNLLIRRLEDPEADTGSRMEAAAELGRREETDALDALLKTLKTGSRDLRIEAIRALGEIADYRSFNGLEDSYYGSDVETRVEILKAMGRSHRYAQRGDFVSVLSEALKSDDAELRKYSAYVASKYVLPSFTDDLWNRFRIEEDSAVKALIVYALGEVPDREERLKFLVEAARSDGIVVMAAEQELEALIFNKSMAEDLEDYLAGQLDHENEVVRCVAVKELSKVGGYGLRFWKMAIEDDSEEVRATGLRRLELSKVLDSQKVSQEELSFLAGSPSEEVRKELARNIGNALMRNGKKTLLKLVEDEEPEVRKEAIGSLEMIDEYYGFPAKRYVNWESNNQYQSIKDYGGEMDSETVSLMLRKLSGEEDEDVLRMIISYLGMSGEPEAFDPIKKVYRQNYGVRLRTDAIEAISKIGKNTDELEHFLYNELDHREDPRLRKKLLSALGNVKNERAVDYLIRALEEEEERRFENTIINALANINTEKARKKVEEVEGEDSESPTIEYVEYQNDRTLRILLNLVAESQEFYYRNRKHLLRGFKRKTASVTRRVPDNPVTGFLKRATLKLLGITIYLSMFLLVLVIFGLVVGAILFILF